MKARAHRLRRIFWWKGIFAEADRPTRLKIFLVITLIAAASIFMQLGFVGIGKQGEYIGYMLALLAPIACAALLLGKSWGLLEGVAAGAILLLHANVQPLDVFEYYLVTPLNSVVLYGFFGLFTGFLLSLALRNDPQRARRKVYLAIVSLIVTAEASIAFYLNFLIDIVISTASYASQHREELAALGSQPDGASAAITSMIPRENIGAIQGVGDGFAQFFFDFIAVYAVFLLADRLLRHYRARHGHSSLRVSFRERLIAVLALSFAVVGSVGFAAITVSSRTIAQRSMEAELQYLVGQLELRQEAIEKEAEIKQLADMPELSSVLGDSVGTILTSASAETVLEGYSLEEDGTLVFFRDLGNGTEEIVLSNNPAFPAGTTQQDLYGSRESGILKSIAESNELRWMLYSTEPPEVEKGNSVTVELGYMLVAAYRDYYVMMAIPASLVYENRTGAVLWAVATSFAILAVAYVAATRLLTRIVVRPIDETNSSLALITAGDLGEVVNVRENTEFDELSNGINSTVDALKGFIDEAERRNAQDLITARRIQEGTLPKQFPAFPSVPDVDLFASMDAAKEVGGDFYDFFEVDDRTVAFLIADVSGKGIPGALFMMAAKNEIENRVLSGGSLAEAIAAANAHLCEHNEAGMFVTVWAATLDLGTGVLTYVNAGHNFPLLRRGRGGSWEWLSRKCGLFLGTFETARYRQEELQLAPGDELLLYTDGVNEAFSATGEEYGNDRLEAFLAGRADLGPRELVPALRADVAAWAEGAEQSDDVTILAVEWRAGRDA